MGKGQGYRTCNFDTNLNTIVHYMKNNIKCYSLKEKAMVLTS
jgi:hypothetical protein